MVGVASRAIWKYWPMKAPVPNIPTPIAIEAIIAKDVVRVQMIFSGMIGSRTLDSTMSNMVVSRRTEETMV